MKASIIIVSLLTVVLITLGYAIYIKFKKKYTRERFAFFGVTSILSLTTSFFAQIYSSQSFISSVINVFNKLFDKPESHYHSDFKDHILGFLLIIFIANLIYKIYLNWNGPISEELYNKQIYHENSTIINEAFLQLKDFVVSQKRKKIIPHIKKDSDKNYNVFAEIEDDRTPWYENVYELLTYSNQQYKIDLDKDYYPEEKCFISKYGLDNEDIVIFCSIDYPIDSAIKTFIHFVKSQKIKYSKVIIAIKNYKGGIEELSKYGIEIIIRNEQEMLDSLVDFSSYTGFIEKLFCENEITDGNKYKLQDIYVPINGKNDKGELIGKVEDYVSNWLNNHDENKHLAILGEYGCGKSVLSIKIAYELLKNRTSESRIPILIELRGRSPRTLNAIEILSTWASKFRLDAASLLKLHKAGKLLLIFEGFDEMDMIGDREMRLNHFQKLWEFALPKAKIIITGRPNFFLDDVELKMNLGIDKPYNTSHYCEAIHLEKLGIDQIKSALRNIDSNIRQQIVEMLDNQINSNFYDLVSRPAILYLVAVIWKERKLSELKDKINSAVVISEFIKFSYSRQGNKNISFPLSEKEREYFMLGIAVGMLWLTEFSNQIGKDELENIILKLYRNFPEEITATDNAMQPKRKPLKARMIDNNYSEDTVLTDVRSCGVLVNELSRKDYFKFAHKSFLEFQVSQFFVESILQDKGTYNIMMNAISTALGISASTFKHSHETIAFTSEILISKLGLNKTDDPKMLCKKLFTVLYPNKNLSKYPYVAAIFDLCGIPFLLLLIMYFTAFYVLNAILDNNSILQKHNLLMILLFIISIALYVLKSIYLKAFNPKDKAIWLQCCHTLNIKRNVIINVVPELYIPFMSVKKSKKMFALFLFMMNNPIELNRLLIQRRIKDDLKFKILDTIHSPYDAKIVEELHTRRPI